MWRKDGVKFSCMSVEGAQNEWGSPHGEPYASAEQFVPAEIRPAGSVPDDWHWADARDTFIRYAQRRALGPSTASLVGAAEDRNSPCQRPGCRPTLIVPTPASKLQQAIRRQKAKSLTAFYLRLPYVSLMRRET